MEVYEIFPSCKSGADLENTVTTFLCGVGFNADHTGKDNGGIDIVAKKKIQETEYTFYIQCRYLIHPASIPFASLLSRRRSVVKHGVWLKPAC